MWRSVAARSRSATALMFGVALGSGWIGAWSPWSSDRAVVSAQESNPLPQDRDQALVTGRCIICHSLQMIAQQRQTRDEWAVIVDRMITYGMPVQPGERDRLLGYLAKYLGQ